MSTSFASAGLADRRTNPATQTQLDAAIVTHASSLLLSVPDLSESERQFLYDIRREEGRFPTKGWARLYDLTLRSRRAAHRRQLGRMFDRTELPPEVYVAVWAASIRETERQGAGDVAMQRLFSEPSCETRAMTKAALEAHRDALADLIDEVDRMPVAA